MDNKTTETVNNICTILGGALLLYPLIDQATKTIIPEMQKLTSDETTKELKQLTDGMQHDKKEHDKKEHDSDHDEISELKRKLAEYEHKGDN